MIKFLYRGKEYEAPSEEMIPEVLGITDENAFDSLYEEIQITFREEQKIENNNDSQPQKEQQKMTKEDFLKMLEKKTQETKEATNPYKNDMFEKQVVDPSKLEGLNFTSPQSKPFSQQVTPSQPVNSIKETVSQNLQTSPQPIEALNNYYKFLNEKEEVEEKEIQEDTYEKIENEKPKKEILNNSLLTEFFIDLYNNILIKIKNRDLQDKMFSVFLDTIEKNDLYIEAVEQDEELTSVIYSLAEELNIEEESEEDESLNDYEEEEQEEDEDYLDDYEEEENLDDYEDEEE